MFLVFQFPFSDLRPFLVDQGNRLPVPKWPLAEPGREFVRSSGAVVARRGGGVPGWAGEEVFSRATAALRFTDHLGRVRMGQQAADLRLICALRRFHSDGSVARLETGFRLRSRSYGPLNAVQCLAVLKDFLDLTVTVFDAQGKRLPCQFVKAGRYLAEHYLRSTTKRTERKLATTESWWLSAGEPLLLLEYRVEELQELPPFSRPIEVAPDQGFRLHHCRLERNGVQVGAWFVGRSLETNRDEIRRLRINLLRLHAEREGVKEVLRQLARKRITVVPGTEASEALQVYLNSALRLLNQDQRHGFDQPPLLAAAIQFTDLASPGAKASIASELDKARRTISRRVDDFVAKQRAEARVINVFHDVEKVDFALQTVESLVMRNIEFGGDVTVHGDFNAVTAEKIENSFNKAAHAEVSGELKDRLKELAVEVAKMTKELPPERAEEAARDLETLTQEAVSPKPRAKWYQLSAEGLVEAAKAVGEVAQPVISTVKAILSLLAL